MGLNDPFTTFASRPGPDDAIYDETFGNIFQFLGYILAEAAQIAAAFARLTGAENLFTAWRSWGNGLRFGFCFGSGAEASSGAVQFARQPFLLRAGAVN